ncbi:hypothetical protein [Bacillus sp. UNC438CL73TsuS30]|uniref:hypothetical protein n=1 Tax=Bacillus sp. UNC438CL73TsuS30 TaxID=1340434 RepID=UPI00047BC833|nr:hypothetical protein [Bacillus sp. UNC438CL73TsuS30]
MRKNVFLFGSIFLIALFVFNIYQLNRPKIGPIGNGEISTISWSLTFFPLILAFIFLWLFIALSVRNRKK